MSNEELTTENLPELTSKSAKYVSTGKYEYVSSSGKKVVCRKGMKGEYCKRHQGNSVSFNQIKAARALEEHIQRSKEKLSPFEQGCIWLYSILNKMPIEQARENYINSTGMYSFLGYKEPNDIEVKGLQKALLKLIDATGNKTSRMDKLRQLVRTMTLGQGFTVAGYHALKDMARESLNKLRVGIAGLGLAGTLTLTGCAGAAPSTGTNISKDINDYKVEGDETKLIEFETIKDANGEYIRTYVDSTAIEFDNATEGKFTDGELKPVLDTAIRFTTLEVLDSIALDDASQWETWKQTIAPQYISNQYRSEILNAVPVTGGNTSNIILQDSDNLLPTLLRDGKVRVADKRVGQVTFKKGPTSGSVTIEVVGSAVVFVDDKNGASWSVDGLQMQNPDGSIMTEEELKAAGLDGGVPANSSYSDGKPNAALISFTTFYTYVKEGGKWMIAGFSNNFNIGTFDNGDNGQLGFRDNIVKK